jgi:hypothetical protein
MVAYRREEQGPQCSCGDATPEMRWRSTRCLRCLPVSCQRPRRHVPVSITKMAPGVNFPPPLQRYFGSNKERHARKKQEAGRQDRAQAAQVHYAELSGHPVRGEGPGGVGHDQSPARAQCLPRADARRDDRRAQVHARGPVHRVRGGDGSGRQGVLGRRRFLRHEAAQFHECLHVERPHAGARHDHPRPADPGDRHGERLVHGRRPRAGPVARRWARRNTSRASSASGWRGR